MTMTLPQRDPVTGRFMKGATTAPPTKENNMINKKRAIVGAIATVAIIALALGAWRWNAGGSPARVASTTILVATPVDPVLAAWRAALDSTTPPAGTKWQPFAVPRPTGETGCTPGETRWNATTNTFQGCK